MSSVGMLASQTLMGLFQNKQHAMSLQPGQDRSRALPVRLPPAFELVACGDHSYAMCPEYNQGCFDFSSMACKYAEYIPVPAPPLWVEPKQAPAQLWTDVPAPNTNSGLSMDAQMCVRRACDALEPTQASLCYCLGTARDPTLCDPPLGLAEPMAVAALAVCSPQALSGRHNRPFA